MLIADVSYADGGRILCTMNPLAHVIQIGKLNQKRGGHYALDATKKFIVCLEPKLLHFWFRINPRYKYKK